MSALDDSTGASGGVGTLTGTPSEIGEKLRRSRAERVVAVTFAHESVRTVNAVAAALGSLAPMVADLIRRRQHESVEKMVDALVPAVPAPEHLLTEARMAAQARSRILSSGDWLTAAQIAELAGFSAANPSAQPNRWKREGVVFAIRHQGVDYFPVYGLNANAGYRPLKALAPVLLKLAGEKDGWGLAYWFASANSHLGGRRPQDVLAQAPDRVVAAAQQEATEIAHG